MEHTALKTFLHRMAPMPLPAELTETIVTHFQPVSLKKGILLLEAGQTSNTYLFLESGYMRSFLLDPEGNEVTVNFHGPGNVVLEVASFFQRVPTQENIQALTDCKGFSLTFEQLNSLFHSIPQFRELGRAVLVSGFVNLKIRTLSMISQTAEQRYEELLKTNPEILLHAPVKHIASYLGVTDTSLSRIRRTSGTKK